MNYWLMLSWKGKFDVEKRLRDEREPLTCWPVPRVEWRDEVRAGDVAFLWQRPTNKLFGEAVLVEPKLCYDRSPSSFAAVPHSSHACAEMRELPWELPFWNPKNIDPKELKPRVCASIVRRLAGYDPANIVDEHGAFDLAKVLERQEQVDRFVPIDREQGELLKQFVAIRPPKWDL